MTSNASQVEFRVKMTFGTAQLSNIFPLLEISRDTTSIYRKLGLLICILDTSQYCSVKLCTGYLSSATVEPHS